MIRIELSPQEIGKIKRLRYEHPHPRVRKRMDVLWLKSQGLRHREICRLTGISNNTLCKYLRMYQSGAEAELTAIRFYTPTSDLEQHKHRLIAFFREHPPATLNEAAEKIQELTGLKRSPSAVGRFLKSLGMRPRIVGAMPSKADPDKQESFFINELEPRIEEAKQGKRALFFVDAAHFVLAPFLGVLWSFVRLFVKAPAGRQRFNVLGALNAITHELVLVTNDTYINAESVCELLRKIALMNIQVPITLVLDNARYQKCNLVAALALQLNIDLLFLGLFRLVWVGRQPVGVPTVRKPVVVAPQASRARSGGARRSVGKGGMSGGKPGATRGTSRPNRLKHLRVVPGLPPRSLATSPLCPHGVRWQ